MDLPLELSAMLVAGSDDGVYRIDGVFESGQTTAAKVLDSERVMRVRQFDAVPGVFAATASGLYHSPDLDAWTKLGVPREKVYAVAASPSGGRLYAGTRPAHVYVSAAIEDETAPGGVAWDAWTELDDVQELPSRDEWHTPRHENLAQVRSLCTHPDAPERVVAGVEVGGVHLSDDGGQTWTERRGAAHDDVHHLHAAGADEFVSATGFGLFRTTDAGRSWTRLDDAVEQRYFREAFTHDGVVYAGAAHGPSSTWDEDTDHALLESRDGQTLEEVESPTPNELAIGWCEAEGTVLASTHGGTLLARRADGYERVGSVPTPADTLGRYLQITWFEE